MIYVLHPHCWYICTGILYNEIKLNNEKKLCKFINSAFGDNQKVVTPTNYVNLFQIVESMLLVTI